MEYLLGGLAAACAGLFSNPFDVSFLKFSNNNKSKNNLGYQNTSTTSRRTTKKGTRQESLWKYFQFS